MSIPFFKNCGPLTEAYVCDILEIKGSNNNNEIRDIKDLYTAEENDVTFFHSTKYINFAKNTKASFCITSNNLKVEELNNVLAKFNIKIQDYMSQNSIDIVLNKNNIFIGKVTSDITKSVLVEINNEFKE